MNKIITLTLALLLLFSPLPAHAAPSDADLIARTLWSEARGECLTGQLLVAQCIVDRVDDGRWGDNVDDVLTYPNQFADPGKLDSDLLKVAEAALVGERAMPEYEVLFFRRTTSTDDWYAPYLLHVGCHAFYGYERSDDG